MIYQSNTSEETKKIAADFAKTLSGGDVVFLEGDLGSGKTTFVQGIGEALGYPDPVRSPTFSIMNIYPIQNHPSIQRVIHLDFYRFKTPDEIYALGLEELIGTLDTVAFIEWPEKGLEKEGTIWHTKDITFRILNDQTREIFF